MNAERASVLFVDDEERILRSLRMQFRGRYEVLTAGSGSDALDIVRSRSVHAVVSDQRMPGMLGAELLSRVREISPATMRLLLTGYSDMQAIVASVNEGEIFRFIEKPWQAQRLAEAVEQAVQVARRELAAPVLAPVAVSASLPDATDIRLLTMDEDPTTFALVRELAGTRCAVEYAPTLEGALAVLSEQEIAIVIAGLRHRSDATACSAPSNWLLSSVIVPSLKCVHRSDCHRADPGGPVGRPHPGNAKKPPRASSVRNRVGRRRCHAIFIETQAPLDRPTLGGVSCVLSKLISDSTAQAQAVFCAAARFLLRVAAAYILRCHADRRRRHQRSCCFPE